MTNIRRYPNEGNIYFLTHGTLDRQPILIANFDILWDSILRVKNDFTFDMMAWVILPDHFHVLIDPGHHDLSGLMKKVKLMFSGKYRTRHGLTGGRVWQYRFWDHIIRNQEDMNRHIDYIHYNPVKHNIVSRPFDYIYSSFKDYIEEGFYSRDWGNKTAIVFKGEFGE